MGTPIEQLQAVRRMRDYAVALSLAPTPPGREEVEILISTRQAAERTATDRTQAEAKKVLAQRVVELEGEINSLEASTGGAQPDTFLVELRAERHTLVVETNTVQNTIRNKRGEYEEKLTDDELSALDAEEKEALERIAAERLARHDAMVTSWRDGTADREHRRLRLTQLHDRLREKLKAATERLDAVRDPLVSRTVAGFLVWAGYSAVAGTGAAVAYLLSTSEQQNSLNTLATSVVGLARDLTDGMPRAIALPIGVLMLLLTLSSVAGVVWGCDKLIHYFDKSWRKQKRRENGFSRTALGLPSPEVGRRAYVQTLAILPFVYIVGLVVLVVTRRAGIGPSGASFGELAPAIIHTAIGSVVTLLATSVFALYVIKVIERRGSDSTSTWNRSWEIAVPPLAIIVAFGVAMARAQADRYVWGALAMFMVLSSIGLAYGVVYRGMFRDVDEVERTLRACEGDIEELDTPPELEEPTRVERNDVKKLQSGYLRRRQTIREEARRRRRRRADVRSYVSSAGSDESSIFGRILGRRAEKGPSVNDWRLIDAELAAEETQRRSDIERRLREIDDEIAAIVAAASAVEARARLAAVRAEHSAARVELATADERGAAEAARLIERQAIELEEFRRGFEIGLTVRPAFEIMRDRAKTTAAQATRYWRKPEVQV